VLFVVLGIAFGCGRSLEADRDRGGSSGTSADSGAEELGGSSGSSASGAGGSAQGGSFEGGSSAQGGSPEGGSTQGGSAGAGGEGGDGALPTRVFLQKGGALVAVDLETAETIELCPDTGTSVQFFLIDWVNERAIFQRQTFTPSPSDSMVSIEIVRVALDGSECTTIFRSDAYVSVSFPAAGDRIVLSTDAEPMSGLERPETDDSAGVGITSRISSLSLDGSLEVIVPNGVFEGPRIVGERVLFQQILEDNSYGFYSALSDGSSITPIPVEGLKEIAAIRGRRVVFNAGPTGDVYAVDADGGNLVALATAPEREISSGFDGNHVFITRYPAPSEVEQGDLYSVGENGGELTPLATSSDTESLAGWVGDRVFYTRTTALYSVRLDGSDTRLIETPEGINIVVGSVGERVVYCSFGDSTPMSCFNAVADGSDRITLHESASGFAAIVGARAVLYVGTDDKDLVSVPLAGGDPLLLSDGADDDWLVGRIGTVLLIQRGDRYNEGEILRIDVDGSRGALLAASARYVGALSEGCAIQPDDTRGPCAE
jgi:hypothetical protein